MTEGRGTSSSRSEIRIKGASRSSVRTTFSGSGPTGQRRSETRRTFFPETSAAPTAARSEPSSSWKPRSRPSESRAGTPTESLAVVRTGVAPRVQRRARRGRSRRLRARREGDGEAGGVVDGNHAGVTVFALEQGSDEADGGAGGEEEYDAVALVPGPAEGFFRLPRRGARRARRAKWAALRRPFAVAAISRSRPAPRDDEGVALGGEAVQLADTFHPGGLQERSLDLEAAALSIRAAGTTLSRPTSASTTERRALTAQSLTISSKPPPVPPTKTASGSGRSLQGFGGFTLD